MAPTRTITPPIAAGPPPPIKPPPIPWEVPQEKLGYCLTLSAIERTPHALVMTRMGHIACVPRHSLPDYEADCVVLFVALGPPPTFSRKCR